MAGSRGIGLACASVLAESGHDVAICGRSRESLDHALEALSHSKGKVTGFTADVSDAGSLQDLFVRVRGELGPIDVLVVNTGGPPPGYLSELDDSVWQAAIDSVLMSAIRSCRLALPSMLERGFGRIIVIGSTNVRRPINRLTLSNVLRPGINGLVKDLAVQYAAAGITVNMLAPGRTDTDRTRQLDNARAETSGLSPAEVRSASQTSIPAGRYGRPGEIAAVVGFLASSEAAYITGQTIAVDGGLTASMP
jgi:3-oxoacyl-[acyl-carrier protein] reductase